MMCSVSEWQLAEGHESFFLVFHEFKSFLLQEFKFLWELGLFREFCKIRKIQKFGVL